MGHPRAEGRVRYVGENTFELQCRTCEQYVPLLVDYWWPSSGLTRCRACWNEYQRLRMAGLRKDEAYASLLRVKGRLNYAMNKEKRQAASRRWREANPERVKASRRAYYERHRDQEKAAARAYYDECRPVVLAKKKAARADKAA